MRLRQFLFKPSASLAFLPVRLGLGLIMMGHGAQKLFAWFDGNGLAATASFFEKQLELAPGIVFASLAGGTQLIAGLFVMLGLLTRFAAFSLAITMLVAIVKVHPDAFFAQNGGMEFPLMLLLASLSLVIGGGGRFAMDRRYAS